MNSSDLRKKFLDFFVKKGHKAVPSSSLISDDPTTLFTTAGMQQFKRYYQNPQEAPSKKIVTIQPCLRTSDINEVGDASHLTFFEMLGNFAFDADFSVKGGSASGGKKEAIELSWEFLTDKKWLGIEKERISTTYFKGEKRIAEDVESRRCLESLSGLKKISAAGIKDNFWSLGIESSPAGPTAEFYIDGIEVWNLVFNQYIFKDGKYEPSKYKGVDTGMGLERLSAIMQNAENVYRSDLFSLAWQKLQNFIEKENVRSERIILDHVRAAVFLIFEGVIPSNKEAGYILRRLIRKATVEGKKLSAKDGFLKEVALSFVYTYKDVFPEIFKRRFQITTKLDKEIAKFNLTLQEGLKKLNKNKENLTGEIAFDLYQTYGFPFELTLDLAKEAKIKINRKEFEKAFLRHKELSRTASAGMFRGGLVADGDAETKYHTATHLLLAALRKILSEKVEQCGSNITAERLRFDFNFERKLTESEIKKIDDLVNEKIKENLKVQMEEMNLEQAKKSGATGIFDSKYGEKVKVYTIGNFSREICGGPHVSRTSELGKFKIIKEESSSAGVRRIKAVLN